MQIEIFHIISGDEAELDRCNAFLRSHRIVQVQTQFVQGNMLAWSVLVTYVGQKTAESKSATERVDYRSILSPEEFIRFAKMRDVRKKMSIDAHVPPFVIFTNDELAKLSAMPDLSLQAMLSIDGIGEKRMEKYGYRFLELYIETEGGIN